MKTSLPCLKSKSPAEFFAENKNIAGFDNVRHLELQLYGALSGHMAVERVHSSDNADVHGLGMCCLCTLSTSIQVNLHVGAQISEPYTHSGILLFVPCTVTEGPLEWQCVSMSDPVVSYK